MNIESLQSALKAIKDGSAYDGARLSRDQCAALVKLLEKS